MNNTNKRAILSPSNESKSKKRPITRTRVQNAVRAHQIKPQYASFMQLASQLYGITLIPEYQFNLERKWKVDFFAPEYKLAIEIEGGTFSKSRHTSPSGFRKDMEKYNSLTLHGIRLIRFLPEQVNNPNNTYVDEVLTRLFFN